MKYVYEKKHLVYYYLTNSLGVLSLDGLFNLHQEMLTEYFSTFGMDNFIVKEKYNSAWVFTKIHADINKYPMWKEEIHLHSEIINIKLAKVYIKTILSDKDNNICAVLYCEACIIDLINRRIVKLSDCNFPMMDVTGEMPTFDSVKDGDNLTILNRTIKYTDIDFTKHTNNVSYIRFILDILSIDFMDNNMITSLDVNYKAETRIDDNITIEYFKIDNEYDFKIIDKDKISTLMVLKYRSK